jgi:hypothetical protein
LRAQAKVLAGAEAEMSERPPFDVEGVRIGKFALPKASATLSPARMVWPCTATSRVAVRLKRCADVLKRSDSSIAGAMNAGSATSRRRASG